MLPTRLHEKFFRKELAIHAPITRRPEGLASISKEGLTSPG